MFKLSADLTVLHMGRYNIIKLARCLNNNVKLHGTFNTAFLSQYMCVIVYSIMVVVVRIIHVEQLAKYFKMIFNHWLIFRSSLQQQSVDNTLPRCLNDESKCNAGDEVDGIENPLYRFTMRDIEKTENIYESLDD